MKMPLLPFILMILYSLESGAGCPAPEPLVATFDVIASESLKPKCIDYSKPSSTSLIDTDQCKLTLKDKKSGKTYVAVVLENQCKIKSAKLTLIGACCSDVAGPQGYCLNYKAHQSEIDSRNDDYACSLGIPYVARATKPGDRDLITKAKSEAAAEDVRDRKRRKEVGPKAVPKNNSSDYL